MRELESVPRRADRAGANEAFPADPIFPQLKVATNPELMQEVFQKHLRPLDQKSYSLRECQVSYIRYAPAAHSYTLMYNLHLVEPDTERERRQWVTGVIYAGSQTQRVWRKLRFRRIWERLRGSLASGRIAAASSAFAPLSCIPELKMLVQVFPYDRQLPALPLLISGPPPELEPLLLARFGPGEWQTEGWDTEPIRYSPERRATFRATLRARETVTGRVEKRHFYVKVYRYKTGERTYQVLRRLRDKGDAEACAFAVARPIAYLSDLRTLIQEEASGTSLRDILLRKDEEIIPAVRKAAQALASLHLGDGVALRRRSLRDEIANLERRGEVLQSVCPHLGPDVKEVVSSVVAGLEEVPPTPTHRDLGLEHILLDGDHLTLIDLDQLAEGDPILDVGRILAQLTNAPLHSTVSPERAWTAAQVFAEEYFAHAPEPWRTRLPFHYAGAVLKIAHGFFWSQVPGWPDKTEALLEEAKNSLAGRIW